MKWFKHDSDANLDAKLQNVLLDYGLEGYGLYWYCLELIAGKVNDENISFELEHDARIIARNTGSTPQKVSEMMQYFVNQKLFESNVAGVISCRRMAKRLDKSMTSNKKMRDIIDGIKCKSHDSVMIGSELSHDKVMQEEKRREEIRKDNIILSDSANAEITKPQRKVDNTPYREIVELYHEICDHMPRIEKITTARKTQISARHKNDLDENLERWAGFFSYVKNNCSWIGQPRENGKRLNLDWLLKESNYLKIKERVYDDKRC